MFHEVTLDTPVLEAIKNLDYEDFMMKSPRLIVGATVPNAAIRTANKIAPRYFSVQETIREAWNQVVLWKPHYCGKKHEQPNSERQPHTCVMSNNPCCGHPYYSRLFQTYGLAGWLAGQKDLELRHPIQILHSLIGTDYEGVHAYGTGGNDDYDPVSPDMVPGIEREIQLLEQKNYETITRPWVQKVAEILRAA